MTKKRKISLTNRILGIKDTITSPYWKLKHHYETQFLPKFKPHYKCTFYDWQTKQITKGWYIEDRKGNRIPWIHFEDSNKLICYNSNYKFTKIED